MELRKGWLGITAFWTLCIFNWDVGNSGKTATKVGLAGIATVAGGSSGGYTGGDSAAIFSDQVYVNGSAFFVNDLQRLKYDLFSRRQYDRTLRPVVDPSTITPVYMDFTMRQILDLDEKNQVLKTYVWMRSYWYDEFLTWNKSDYGGLSKLWVPINTVWRPDIVVYEDTGSKDYNPRLPFATINSEGRVSSAEPSAFETSCSINIAFFPFDYQDCSLTFTSWTFPSSQVDVIARKSGSQIMEDVEKYFMKSGEWNIAQVTVVKTSENFGTIALDSGVDENKRKQIDETKTVQEVAPDRLTEVHWADIKYTFVLRRNSSLYMQSMLFPAILLTTVALLGFYLPPDSGERIGLQITILLTFMVFLLTVGEMFPASTGPFLGVYYVLCMALLGINLFMTVLVLHLHYMPSAAVMGANRDGIVTSKPVPKWIRFLLHVAKFKIRSHDEDRCSPTSQIVRNIMKTGYLSARIPSGENIADVKGEECSISEWQEEEKMPNSTRECSDCNENNQKQNRKKNGKKMICTDKTSIPPRFRKKVSPSGSVNGDDASVDAEQDDNRSEAGSSVTATYGKAEPGPNERKNTRSEDNVSGHSTTPPSVAKWSSKSSGSDETSSAGDTEQERKLRKILDNLNMITHYLKTQNEHLQDSNLGDDVENEWKAMARTIDKLCMKFYLFLLVVSHVGILAAALVESYLNSKG